MLVLFFTIIFIAELIVAGWIVSHIISFNKTICETNQKVLELQPQIITEIRKARITLCKLLKDLDCFVTFVAEKQDNCKLALKQNLLSSVAAFILKIPMKKIITVINVITAIKKFIK